MNSYRYFLCWFLIYGLRFASAQTTNNVVNYAEKVNTLIGNKGKGVHPGEDHLEAGFTYPGATYPFGMVQFTPTFFNADKGFVVNQLSGAGCWHMGNFAVLPMVGAPDSSPNDMEKLDPQIHAKKAMAGYYNAGIKGGIDCRLSVTKRTGMAIFTFPQGNDKGTIIIGSGISGTRVAHAGIKITGPATCEGIADGGDFCGINTAYKIYFVARFDVRPSTAGVWEGKTLKPSATIATGQNSGAYFVFDVNRTKTVQYKFGISYVSIKNAWENLDAENPGWDFNKVRSDAENAWNYYLQKIEATGAGNERTVQFYTHLYHSLIHPSISNDVNGEYISGDHKVHKAVGFDNYTNLSNWDTYRTQIQLISMLAPKQASDVITSTIDFARLSGGGLPRWVLADIETGIMQGDPTSLIIANAYAFGAKNFDTKSALAIMRRGAELPGTASQNELTRPYLAQYLKKGYLNASLQLEYTSADFAIGQFALQTTGSKGLYQRYLKQAQSWKNLYDPATTWLRSRNADGSWKRNNDDWMEASYKNYFWMVPFNLKGLTNLIGGNTAAEHRLDDLFNKLDASYNQDWYAAGNEPDFETPWIYNWVGVPYKTQLLVKRIIKTSFANTDSGLPGNDDLGAMGAWYVFANMGLYPIVPGIGGFAVNSPSFATIKVHLGSGKTLTITGGDENLPYIRSMELNGKAFDSTWILLNQLDGGTLNFRLSDLPNKQWGVKTPPPSFN